MEKQTAVGEGEGTVLSPSSAAVHTDPKTDPSLLHAERTMEIAENAKDAGCYTFLTEVWTVDEHHQDLTASIRKEAEPRYVPLICRRVYISPAGTEVVRNYHVIGKYIEFPTDEYREDNIKLSHVPRSFPFPSDRIQALRTLWAPWDSRGEDGKYLFPTEYSNNTPPEEVEIGPWLLDQMKALRKFFDTPIRIDGDEVSADEYESDKKMAILAAETLADNKRVQDARDEARYRMRHNWKQLKEAADNGRWSPEPLAASPFIDLGRKET